ncbi:MAG TPA: MFS transporter [Herpetosiphonaceae bacterium]
MVRIRLPRLQAARAGIWLSCSYFWYFAAIGCFAPYIALYYRHLQLSGLQIGVLGAILPLGIAFIAPLWGGLADSFSAHRLLLRCTLLVAVVAALLLSQTTSFVALLPLMVLLAICLAAVPALLDSYAMMISDREGTSFGRIRMWGSIGFIVMVWLLAWWMGQSVSSVFLIAYAVTLLLTCAATLGLPPLQPRSAQPIWQGVSEIVRDRSVALLLLTVYLVTSNATIMSSYLGIYLIEIGGTARLVGTASVVAAISELPVLIFGRWLLERFTSRRIFILAVGAYMLRFLLYSIPPSPYAVLAVQLLHGLSFGMYLMASVTLVHELAGRERAATAQGLLSSTSLGFGAITGSLVGGALLDRIGAVGIFRVAAVGMLMALGVCLLSARASAARRAVTKPVLRHSQK